MKARLGIFFPSVIGVLSLPLILWDIHNARAIESMGMAWDTGAPVWPYQASDIFLRFLNGPAYSVAMPIANQLRLAAPMHFILVVPAILTWWWFAGWALDRGVQRWQLIGMFGVLLTLLLWTTTAIQSLLRLRMEFLPSNLSGALLVLRFVTPAAWFFALTCLLLGRRKVPRGHQLA